MNEQETLNLEILKELNRHIEKLIELRQSTWPRANQVERVRDELLKKVTGSTVNE
jgi:hypothetical protein